MIHDERALLEACAVAARAAGVEILKLVAKGFEVETKGDQSPVTVCDRAAERIILDALLGLGAVHDAKDGEGRPLEIIHRDVSPQNVLVGLDGRGKLTDFGIAHASSRLHKTQGAEIKGKLAYLAPEQRVRIW